MFEMLLSALAPASASPLADLLSTMIRGVSAQLLFSTLLFLPIVTMTLWQGQRRPGLLYGLWLLVLIRLILPPDLSAPWSLAEQWKDVRAVIPAPNFSTLAASNTPQEPDSTSSAVLSVTPVLGVDTDQALVSQPISESSIPSALWAALALWGFGAALFGALYLKRSAPYARLLRHAVAVDAPAILSATESWRRRFGIRRNVGVITCGTDHEDRFGPFTAGILNPRIYLPRTLIETAEPSVLDAVIAHEAAHIKRWDYLWIRLQGWLQVVYFFHPVVWIASGQLNRLRETLCDQLVLEKGTISRSSYGRSLLAVLTLQTKTEAGMLLPMPALGHHRRRRHMRMEEILHQRLPGRRERLLAGALTLGLAFLILPMASADSDDAEPEIVVVNEPDQPAYKRTVIELRRVGKAVKAWSESMNNGEPRVETGARAHLIDGRLPIYHYTLVSAYEMERLLVPHFLKEVPLTDGWGNPYEYRLNLTEPTSKILFMMRSPGSDGQYEGDSYAVGSFGLDALETDIVYADGYYVTWPVPDSEDR